MVEVGDEGGGAGGGFVVNKVADFWDEVESALLEGGVHGLLGVEGTEVVFFGNDHLEGAGNSGGEFCGGVVGGGPVGFEDDVAGGEGPEVGGVLVVDEGFEGGVLAFNHELAAEAGDGLGAE